MPVIMANGLQTHYYDDNLSAPAEPAWIQHGFGRNANFWWEWVAPLAGTYRVLRRDLRGHGGSGAPDANTMRSILIARMTALPQ